MTTSSRWLKTHRSLGWWIICCPPLGWLMALGYRKHVVIHLLNPDQGHELDPLPPTISSTRLLIEGMGALGVIIFYFTPALMLAFSWGTGSTPWSSADSVCKFLQYVMLTYTLPPLTLGGATAYYQLEVSGFELSLSQGVMVSGALILCTFLIPLAFMQVGKRGLWRDALRIDQAARTLWRSPRAYLRAWRDSLWISAVALSLLHRAPWGIAWSYLSIVWLFNRAHAREFPNNLIETSLPSDLPLGEKQRWGVSVPIWWRSPHDTN